VDQHQRAAVAAAHNLQEFFISHIHPPMKWVHVVQMPVNGGTLSDIKGNAAYW